MRMAVTWHAPRPAKTATVEPAESPFLLDHRFFDEDPRISGRSGPPLSIEWVGNMWQVHNRSLTHGLWVRVPYPAANVGPYDIWPLVEQQTELWPAARGQATEFALTVRLDSSPVGLADPRLRGYRSATVQQTAPTVDPFTGSDPRRLVDVGGLDPFDARRTRERELRAAARIYAATFQTFFAPGRAFGPGHPADREVVSATEVAKLLEYKNRKEDWNARRVNKAFEGRYAWFLRDGDPLPDEQNKEWFLGNLLRHGLLGIDDIRALKAST